MRGDCRTFNIVITTPRAETKLATLSHFLYWLLLRNSHYVTAHLSSTQHIIMYLFSCFLLADRAVSTQEAGGRRASSLFVLLGLE